MAYRTLKLLRNRLRRLTVFEISTLLVLLKSSIKQKGKFSYTIKCANSEAAKSVEDTLKEKYRSAIKINPVGSATKPLIKIVRMYTDVTQNANPPQTQLDAQTAFWLTKKGRFST